MDDDAAKVRRIYGKGVRDGMNIARMRQLEQGLEIQERKVYDAIPVGSPISKSQLMNELTKTMGRPDQRAVDRCVLNMVDLGLVKDLGGKYQRTPPRMALVPNEVKPVPLEPKNLPATAPAVVAAGTSEVVSQLRAKIDQALNCLAEAEALCSKLEADSAKVQKLKDALQGLL